MQEQIAEVLYIFKGTLKHKWAILVIAWVLCIAGWLVVSAMPDKYTSEAKVHVDKNVLDSIMSRTLKHDIAEQLRVMQQLMFTDGNLEEIIKLSSLDKNIKKESDRQPLMESLRKNIRIIAGSDQIFNIRFEAKSPVIAQNVVLAVLTVFSDNRIGIHSDEEKALKFIEDQIKDYESQLKTADKAKEDFKRFKLGIELKKGQGSGSMAEVEAISKQLREAKLQLTVALSRRQALQEQFEEAKDNLGWDEPDVNEPLPEEDEQIKLLKDQLKVLRIKYKDQHPEIVSLLKEIEALERSKKIEVSNSESQQSKSMDSIHKNKYLQQIKTGLNEAITQVATAQASVDALNVLKNDIAEDLDSQLKIETQMQNLNRNYETIKATYEGFLKNREDLILSIKIGKEESLQFKIEDAPNIPLQPSSPNRKLLFSAVFAGAIISGFGIAFLLYFIRPRVMSTSQVRQITGLPILGSVSMKSSPGLSAKIKMEYLKYGYASLALIFIYAGLMTIDILEIKTLTLSHWL